MVGSTVAVAAGAFKGRDERKSPEVTLICVGWVGIGRVKSKDLI
jgi:hypothetical protein